MSRKTKRFTLNDISALERKGGQVALQRVQALAAIDPTVIAALVAVGPLNLHHEFVTAAIESFVGLHAEQDKLLAVRNACAAQDVSDECTSVEISLAEDGYRLGLAVGLALGSGQPFALKGGAR
jgi:hypothetical protein